jgi:6-phosphogluconolactonase/glucosamine-6-phosphate isomerase/deaminase
MAVQFLKVTSDQVEARLLETLDSLFKKYNRILWVITGGSNILLVAKIMKQVSDEDSAKLAMILSDERYGPVGHPDSNLQLLYEAGFDPKKATIVPVLRSGLSLSETTKLYGEALQTAFEAADYSLGLFGMGIDGHVAGILPGSTAVTTAKKWSYGYDTDQFVRITMTPFAISHLSEAVLIALGEPKKRPVLESLKKQLSAKVQPAQLLKKVPMCTVMNDQVGEVL